MIYFIQNVFDVPVLNVAVVVVSFARLFTSYSLGEVAARDLPFVSILGPSRCSGILNMREIRARHTDKIIIHNDIRTTANGRALASHRSVYAECRHDFTAANIAHMCG